MTTCFFVSDIHGRVDRYQKLFSIIRKERPEAVFMGGDILPSEFALLENPDGEHQHFINDFLKHNFTQIQHELGDEYPKIFLILGNDDGRFEEEEIISGSLCGLWKYIHGHKISFKQWIIYGYSYVPPTPYMLKDWEKYDVSRYIDPGCISPEEGRHSLYVSEYDLKFGTIQEDLELLTNKDDMNNAVLLFHAPPYKTKLDRAALDGKVIDSVPLDVHVGSIAIHRFIENHQPLLTLHGHVHESARITGSWQEYIRRTCAFNAAHDGQELALITFNMEDLTSATRRLL